MLDEVLNPKKKGKKGKGKKKKWYFDLSKFDESINKF